MPERPDPRRPRRSARRGRVARRTHPPCAVRLRRRAAAGSAAIGPPTPSGSSAAPPPTTSTDSPPTGCSTSTTSVCRVVRARARAARRSSTAAPRRDFDVSLPPRDVRARRPLCSPRPPTGHASTASTSRRALESPRAPKAGGSPTRCRRARRASARPPTRRRVVLDALEDRGFEPQRRGRRHGRLAELPVSSARPAAHRSDLRHEPVLVGCRDRGSRRERAGGAARTGSGLLLRPAPRAPMTAPRVPDATTKVVIRRVGRTCSTMRTPTTLTLTTLSRTARSPAPGRPSGSVVVDERSEAQSPVAAHARVGRVAEGHDDELVGLRVHVPADGDAHVRPAFGPARTSRSRFLPRSRCRTRLAAAEGRVRSCATAR